jgi:hypothetical protein
MTLYIWLGEKNKTYTLLYILVGIHDTVHAFSYAQCHVYLLVYTIVYMLYSSDLIICTMSCIPTGIYKAYTLLFITVGRHDMVHMIRWEE